MKGGDFADRGVVPRPAGEDDRIYSGSGPKAHVEFHQQDAWPSIIAEALSNGSLFRGGRFELRSGRLRREAGRTAAAAMPMAFARLSGERP